MTSPAFSVNASGVHVQFPVGFEPPEPLASTLKRLQEVHDRCGPAMRERDSADRNKANAKHADTVALRDSMVKGTKPPTNPTEHQERANVAAMHAQAVVSALMDARSTLYRQALKELQDVRAEWAAELFDGLEDDEQAARDAVAILRRTSKSLSDRMALIDMLKAGSLAAPGSNLGVRIGIAVDHAQDILRALDEHADRYRVGAPSQ